MWLFVFVRPESECREPGLQCGREGHLGMKIRYPMECFNGKKMSLLWAGESVIMQEEECDYESSVFVLRMPPRLCTSVCACGACSCMFIHAWSVQVCIPRRGECLLHLLTRSPIHTVTPDWFTPCAQYADFLMMLQCCGWWSHGSHSHALPKSHITAESHVRWSRNLTC